MSERGDAGEVEWLGGRDSLATKDFPVFLPENRGSALWCFSKELVRWEPVATTRC
jgi:hypothetical protein